MSIPSSLSTTLENSLTSLLQRLGFLFSRIGVSDLEARSVIMWWWFKVNTRRNKFPKTTPTPSVDINHGPKEEPRSFSLVFFCFAAVKKKSKAVKRQRLELNFKYSDYIFITLFFSNITGNIVLTQFLISGRWETLAQKFPDVEGNAGDCRDGRCAPHESSSFDKISIWNNKMF